MTWSTMPLSAALSFVLLLILWPTASEGGSRAVLPMIVSSPTTASPGGTKPSSSNCGSERGVEG